MHADQRFIFDDQNHLLSVCGISQFDSTKATTTSLAGGWFP
jgi:hypothetical protein